MNGKNLLESVSESVNDDLRLRNEYLVAENRILRKQIDGRVQLTDSERKELAEIGAKLGKQALSEIATIAQADTILAWHRKVGRPRVNQEIEDCVLRMALLKPNTVLPSSCGQGKSRRWILRVCVSVFWAISRRVNFSLSV
jgi:hypothetical protein